MANFDADFEKYIIFHRGVAKVEISDTGRLFVYYQDGTHDDLGDVYRQEDVSNLNNLVDTLKNDVSTLNTQMTGLQDAVTNFNQDRADLQAMKTAAESAKDAAVEAQNSAQNSANEAIEAVDGIDPVYVQNSSGENTTVVDHYRVNMDQYTTTVDTLNTLIPQMIKRIAGVVDRDSASSSDSVGPLFDIVLTSDQYNKVVDEVFKVMMASGAVAYNQETQEYYIPRIEPIEYEDIDHIFTENSIF